MRKKMKNKTFKEEALEKFDSKFGDVNNNVEGNRKIVATGIEIDGINSFISDILNLYKQKILEALPKEESPAQYDLSDPLTAGYQLSRAKCLSEVKQIIVKYDRYTKMPRV